MPKIDNQMKLYHTIVKAMERCSSKEIMKEQEKTLGQNALKHTSVSEIVKHVKEGADLTDNHGKFDHKFVRMEELVGEVKEAIEVNCLVDLHTLANDFMVSYGTIQKIVTDDLNLVIKLASWMPRLLDKGQKEK